MNEKSKNKLILILALFSILLVITSLSSCNINRKIRAVRDKEMATRLDLEEKVSKIEQQKDNLEKKVVNLSKELEQEKAVQETTKKSLNNEKSENDKLRDELEKITKLKEKLEENLKEALVNNKNHRKTRK
ncbi:MAG: hypothetical protein ABIH18_04240 [Candidatus Omnitrophota bacterium]